MSRLDRFIARVTAQRALLDHACADLNARLDEFPGPICELGLGNGRTYDHLRAKSVGRRIVVFERDPCPDRRSRPPDADLLVGEIEETAQRFASEQGRCAVLVHADLGNGTPEYDAAIASWLPGVCLKLLRPGGLILTSTPLAHPDCVAEPVPPEIGGGVYSAYRVR